MNYTIQETAEYLETSIDSVQSAIAALSIPVPISAEDVDRIQQWIVMHPTSNQPQTKRAGKRQQSAPGSNLAGASIAIAAQAANARQPLAVLADRLAEQQISDAQHLANMLNPATYTEGVLLRAISILAETEQEPIDFDLGLEGDDIFTSRLQEICGVVDQPQLGSVD